MVLSRLVPLISSLISQKRFRGTYLIQEVNQIICLTTISRPSQNIPKAILAQFIVEFFTAMFYLIAILTSHYLFPLSVIY